MLSIKSTSDAPYIFLNKVFNCVGHLMNGHYILNYSTNKIKVDELKIKVVPY